MHRSHGTIRALAILVILSTTAAAEDPPAEAFLFGEPIVDREHGVAFAVPAGAKSAPPHRETAKHYYRWWPEGPGGFDAIVYSIPGVDTENLDAWLEEVLRRDLTEGRRLLSRTKGLPGSGVLTVVRYEHGEDAQRMEEVVVVAVHGDRLLEVWGRASATAGDQWLRLLRTFQAQVRVFTPGDKRLVPPDPHQSTEVGKVRLLAAKGVAAATARGMAEELDGGLAALAELVGLPVPRPMVVHCYPSGRALHDAAPEMPVDAAVLTYIPAGRLCAAHAAPAKDKARADRDRAAALAGWYLDAVAGTAELHPFVTTAAVEHLLAHRRSGKTWTYDRKSSPALTALRDASRSRRLGPLRAFLTVPYDPAASPDDLAAARALALTSLIRASTSDGRRRLLARYLEEFRALADRDMAVEAAMKGADLDAMEKEWGEAWQK